MLDGDRMINRMTTLTLLATALVAACAYAEDVAGWAANGDDEGAWLIPVE